MNNIELESKIKELLEIENYFDFMIALKGFEGEYKQSDFYKATKMNLLDAIKNARIHYILQLKDLSKKVNNFLNSLNLEKIQELIEQFGSVLGQENEEVMKEINALNLGELFSNK